MKPFSFLLALILFVALTGCRPASPAAVPLPPAAAPTSIPPTQEPVMPTSTPQPEVSPTEDAGPAYAANARLARSVNLGNALEAPREGEWGVTLQAAYFKLIHEQGFSAVRVPIRWSAHAGEKSPYTIDPQFFARIDWVVEQARKNDLAVILDMHHYVEMVADPAAQHARFLALWEQIAAHYQSTPDDSVFFELLNEPNGDAFPAETWNNLVAETLAKIRPTNPNRVIIVGPVQWNSVDLLDTLRLPDDDRRIIVTFHYYQPFNFTHQGAEWAEGSDQWLGTTWEGTETEKSALSSDLDKAFRWSQANRRPVLLGEFGAYSKADMPSRARWTAYVARQAEARGIRWAYWEFCSGFGVYDPSLRQFNQPLLQALIPPGE